MCTSSDREVSLKKGRKYGETRGKVDGQTDKEGGKSFRRPDVAERTDPPDPRYVEVSGVGSVWEVVPPMKTIALSVDSLEQFARPSKLLRSAFDLVFLGGEVCRVRGRGLAEICSLSPRPDTKV